MFGEGSSGRPTDDGLKQALSCGRVALCVPLAEFPAPALYLSPLFIPARADEQTDVRACVRACMGAAPHAARDTVGLIEKALYPTHAARTGWRKGQ